MAAMRYLALVFVMLLGFLFWPLKVKAVNTVFTSSGTFTAPDGIYSIEVGCWGGGGGGGGSRKNNTSYAGGGGGGGAFAKTTGIGVTPSSGYSVVVGLGGAGGGAGSAGSAGNSSTFATSLVVAVGGGAGGYSASAVGASGGGGLASNCTGDTGKKFSGGNGAKGLTGGGGGGGGGGAGDAAAGSSTTTSGGGAGGTQNGGIGGSGGVSGANGAIGSTFGGGGGGGGKGSSSAGRSGGKGADGRCVVSFTDTWAPSVTQSTYTPTWSFASNPQNIGPTGIGMTATTGYDYTGPIKYLFTLDNSACTVGNSGSGGSNSSWQTETSYSASGLQANKCYGFRVSASDSVGTTKVGTVSSIVSTYTSANIPGTPVLGSATLSTLNLTNEANSNPATNPTTNFAVQVVTSIPNDSTWLNKWVNTSGDPVAAEVWMSDATLDGLVLRGLKSGTIYGVKVKARNQDNDETILSAEGQSTTNSAIISISVSDGAVSYGIVPSQGTKSTIDLSDTQIVKNEGSVPEDFTIKTSNAMGGIGWTLVSFQGTDMFVHEFSSTAGVGWTKFDQADVYQPFVSNIGVSSGQTLDLRLTAPSISSDAVSKTVSVTILATQH